MRCRSCCMLCRAKTSSVSQVGLDAATPAVLFSFMGGVSFPGVSAPVVRWSTNRRLHRLLFVYTPTDVTSASLLMNPSDEPSGTIRAAKRAWSILGAATILQAPSGWEDDSDTASHSHSRSEEHTSELQSLRHLVCRLLLEKKKT